MKYSSSKLLVCDICDFISHSESDCYALISKVDSEKYSWLAKLNKEDRPEYHAENDRIHDKRHHQSSGYVDRLIEEIKPKVTDIVLDLGCGRGQISDPLCGRVKTVFSLDLLPENLIEVQNHNKFLATADNIPLVDGSVDLVIFTDVLEHLPPNIQSNVLKEIFRVLKPGGRVLISYPGNNLPNLTGVHLINLAVFIIRFFDKRVTYMSSVEPPAHINMSYPWRIKKEFKDAGFLGDIRPYNNKFLTLPYCYQVFAKFLNLPILRSIFIHQMHGLLHKPSNIK